MRAAPRWMVCVTLVAAGCSDDSEAPAPDLAQAADQSAAASADLSMEGGADLGGRDLASNADQTIRPPDFAGTDFSLPPSPDLFGMAPGCMDTVKNGSETDVDCGGPMCPACDLAKACQMGSDCKSRLCLNLACATPPMSRITFAAPAWYGAGTLPVHVASGDLNGDGKVDLVTANEGSFGKSSDVSVLIGKGDGTFAAQVRSAVGFSPSWVTAVDLNGDKRSDVVASNRGAGNNAGSVSVLLANAQGVLGMATSTNLSGGPAVVLGGDLNRDGKADVMVIENGQGKPGSADVLAGKGDGTLLAPVAFAVGSSPSDALLADWNLDNVLDVAVANGGDFSGPSLCALHLGGANATFAAGKSVQAGPGTTAVATGDLDGDAKADLVTVFTSNGAATLAVLLGRGDGTFQPALTTPLKGFDPAALAIADFDGDKKPDVALLYRSGTLGLFAGTGKGGTQPEVGFAVTAAMGGSSLLALDLNGDAKPDVAAADYFKGQVVVLLNTTP